MRPPSIAMMRAPWAQVSHSHVQEARSTHNQGESPQVVDDTLDSLDNVLDDLSEDSANDLEVGLLPSLELGSELAEVSLGGSASDTGLSDLDGVQDVFEVDLGVIGGEDVAVVGSLEGGNRSVLIDVSGLDRQLELNTHDLVLEVGDDGDDGVSLLDRELILLDNGGTEDGSDEGKGEDSEFGEEHCRCGGVWFGFGGCRL